jgi:hypothetical protein
MAVGPEQGNKAPHGGGATSGAAKAAEKGRLAEALRENLRRRKAQECGRRAAAADRPGKLPD